MAKFNVRLANGDEIGLEAEAIDNIPEFMTELKTHGFVAGRDNEGPIAVCQSHVASVRPIG